jgi:hypothetical protein
MHTPSIIVLLTLMNIALSGTYSPLPSPLSLPNKSKQLTQHPAPTILPHANPCFIIGNTALPAEVQDSVTSIQDIITCNTAITTISGVPDVISGGISFSSIDFATSKLTPLNFALTTFATATPLASSNLTLFQSQLNTYLATEAGIRSVAGSLAIKDPKFFLSFQIARILTVSTPQVF